MIMSTKKMKKIIKLDSSKFERKQRISNMLSQMAKSTSVSLQSPKMSNDFIIKEKDWEEDQDPLVDFNYIVTVNDVKEK